MRARRNHPAGHYALHCWLAMLILLASATISPLPPLASPPDTAVLKWAIIDTPGSFPDRNDIRSPCETNVLAVAADASTIYAIDIPNATPGPIINPGVWKSSDGGINWSPKPTQHLVEATPTPTLPAMDIALAPDNPSLVAVVCLNSLGTLRREVYLSEDGSSTWTYSGAIPWLYGIGEQIGDIAISPAYNLNGKTVHDIIACSRHPADGKGEGEIYVLQYPGFGGWKAQGFVSGDAIAVRCSPNYTADFSLVVMAATTKQTYLCLGHRDLAANTCQWNIELDWPVEMCAPEQSGGSSSGEDKIISGDIALPSDFVGTSIDQRIIFAAYDSNGTAMWSSQVLDDVYRLDNTMVTRLKLPGCGRSARISSIAYAGDEKEGKLLAGDVFAETDGAAARVWVCLNPLACATWNLATKPPRGGGNIGYANAQVAWSANGSITCCATGSGNRDTPQKWADPTNPTWSSQSLDESAISISRDNGWSWNQVGLIDTRSNRLNSVAVAQDESTLYLASVNDSGFDSLWRSQSSVLGAVWQRVMCFAGESPILRLSSL